MAEACEDQNLKTKGECVNEKQSAASAETVNEKLSSVAVETKPDQSADSITLACLLMLAKEKEAVNNENYQILPGWNTSTKAKAKRIIGKMIELMDEEEKKILVHGAIPKGVHYEKWKTEFKTAAVTVQKRFLQSLTARYNMLPACYQNGQGLSKKGKEFFVGAANREAALSTAEKKLWEEEKRKDNEKKQVEKKEAAKKIRSSFFTSGKRDDN